MNTSQVMIQYLAAAGVGHIFGYPGDPSVEFLEAARRQVILAGISAVWSGASGSLARLAETIGAPVVVAPMSKGVISDGLLMTNGLSSMMRRSSDRPVLGNVPALAAEAGPKGTLASGQPGAQGQYAGPLSRCRRFSRSV